uniref:Uncharacterized protein n=1 Tax=Heterorhabditis bacteriophora TaxID=37862 RepID=A0A1I7WKW2_HETBA
MLYHNSLVIVCLVKKMYCTLQCKFLLDLPLKKIFFD